MMGDFKKFKHVILCIFLLLVCFCVFSVSCRDSNSENTSENEIEEAILTIEDQPHPDPADDTAATVTQSPVSPGWVQKPASSSGISNGCNTRPCNDADVCVPTASTSASSHVCLPLPPQCGIPEAVSHGNVSISGNSHGDVAHVTYDEGYVASPKGVSVELVCLVTSNWTPFAGVCQQYEFIHEVPTTVWLPWQLEENSQLCIRGIFEGFGKWRVRFTGGHMDFRVVFRNTEKSNVIWKLNTGGAVELGDNPLGFGDSFNFTVHFLADTISLSLNESYAYNLLLADIKYQNGTQANLWETQALRLKGNMTYVNLIAGC